MTRIDAASRAAKGWSKASDCGSAGEQAHQGHVALAAGGEHGEGLVEMGKQAEGFY